MKKNSLKKKKIGLNDVPWFRIVDNYTKHQYLRDKCISFVKRVTPEKLRKKRQLHFIIYIYTEKGVFFLTKHPFFLISEIQHSLINMFFVLVLKIKLNGHLSKSNFKRINF